MEWVQLTKDMVW